MELKFSRILPYSSDLWVHRTLEWTRRVAKIFLSKEFLEFTQPANDWINYALKTSMSADDGEVRGFFVVSSFARVCGFWILDSLKFTLKNLKNILHVMPSFLKLRHFSIFHSEWFQFQFVTRITLRIYQKCRQKTEKIFTDYIFRIIAWFDME